MLHAIGYTIYVFFMMVVCLAGYFVLLTSPIWLIMLFAKASNAFMSIADRIKSR